MVNRLVRAVHSLHNCSFSTSHTAQEDSVLLWKSIVSNPLLAKTSLVLFLNKIDIMKAKLQSGIRFGDYIVSYGNRPNDFDSTSNCK